MNKKSKIIVGLTGSKPIVQKSSMYFTESEKPQVIKLYNDDRPPVKFGNLRPSEIHHMMKRIKTEKRWKNYYQKSQSL